MTTVQNAKVIASAIKHEFKNLFQQAKEILTSNLILSEAISKDGGIRMMLNEGFQFNAFSQGAVNSKERIMAYDEFPLEGYIEANKDRIHMDRLEKLLEVFKQRKEQLLEAFKQSVTKENARNVSMSIYENLILKTLDIEPIFG